MNRIFNNLDFDVVFDHDICIASASEKEHRQYIRVVIERLQKNGLVLNLTKCRFAQKEVDFLGYRVCIDGIKPQLERVQAVVNNKLPIIAKEWL